MSGKVKSYIQCPRCWHFTLSEDTGKCERCDKNRPENRIPSNTIHREAREKRAKRFLTQSRVGVANMEKDKESSSQIGNESISFSQENPTASMTKVRYNLAGWLSIISAIITLPILIFSIYSGAKYTESGKTINILLTLSDLGMFLYIIWSLKILLNSRFHFYNVDNNIALLSEVYIATSVIAIVSLLTGTNKTIIVTSVIASVVLGIVDIVFAIKLLSLSNNLYGFLKPFSYTSIAMGVCYATVILLPLGLVIGIVNYVILGMTFFKASEKGSSQQQSFANQEIQQEISTPTTGIPDKIKQLAELKEQGILSETEFEQKKKELLSKL